MGKKVLAALGLGSLIIMLAGPASAEPGAKRICFQQVLEGDAFWSCFGSPFYEWNCADFSANCSSYLLDGVDYEHGIEVEGFSAQLRFNDPLPNYHWDYRLHENDDWEDAQKTDVRYKDGYYWYIGRQEANVDSYTVDGAVLMLTISHYMNAERYQVGVNRVPFI